MTLFVVCCLFHDVGTIYVFSYNVKCIHIFRNVHFRDCSSCNCHEKLGTTIDDLRGFNLNYDV